MSPATPQCVMGARSWSLLFWLTLSAFCKANVIARSASVELVYQYEGAVWIENLAVRPDGWILPATATSAVLTQLNPVNGEQQVLHDWSKEGNAIMSITDVQPDVFLANTMYCDLSILACTPGTGITWLVDLRGPSAPCIKELARGPDPASLLNGVAALNGRTVLMVDQALGGIWGVDVFHGGAELLFTDESMMDPNSTGNGVNGIRVRGDILYFNNPSIGTFSRIPIDPSSGRKAGKATVITSGLEPDDFEIDEQERFAYLTNGPEDQLLKIDLSTGLYEVVADNLPGPTSARWISKRERGKVLYVSTVGGYEGWLSGNVTLGGAIYRVSIKA